MVPVCSRAKTTAVPNGTRPGGLQVLVVEDDADNAASMAMILGLCGHDVQIALDGSAALEAARSARPDVVLIDLGLPGMDGCEVARQLSLPATDKPPFLIAVTGFGDADARRRSLESGIDLHLVKPVNWEQLRNLLEKFQKTGDGQHLGTLTTASAGGQ